MHSLPLYTAPSQHSLPACHHSSKTVQYTPFRRLSNEAPGQKVAITATITTRTLQAGTRDEWNKNKKTRPLQQPEHNPGQSTTSTASGATACLVLLSFFLGSFGAPDSHTVGTQSHTVTFWEAFKHTEMLSKRCRLRSRQYGGQVFFKACRCRLVFVYVGK